MTRRDIKAIADCPDVIERKLLVHLADSAVSTVALSWVDNALAPL